MSVKQLLKTLVISMTCTWTATLIEVALNLSQGSKGELTDFGSSISTES